MSYSRHIYIKAERDIEKRRTKAENEQRKNHETALLKIPALTDLDAEIASAGLQVIKAIGMGENAQKYIESLSKKNLLAQRKRIEMLKKAGFPADFLQIHYTCEKCRDTGFIEGYRCDCFKDLVRSIAYDSLCSEAPLNKCRFDNFDVNYYSNKAEQGGIVPREKMREIYDYCKSYAQNFETGVQSILMLGATGLGKTHLSLAIAGVLTESGFGVIYGSAQNLLSRLEKEHFGKSGNYNMDTENLLLECDMLILDDLGAEFSTTFTVAAIYNIINTRIMKSLPTIINTNLNHSELEEKYTQRILSRMIGSFQTLVFQGRDIRQIKNPSKQ